MESVTTGQAVDWEVQGAKLLAVAEYAPGKIAVGGTDNQVHLFDLASRQVIRVLKQHTGSVSAMACRDDYLITGSYDTVIRVRSSKDLNLAPSVKRSPAPAPAVTAPAATSLNQKSDDTFRVQR